MVGYAIAVSFCIRDRIGGGGEWGHYEDFVGLQEAFIWVGAFWGVGKWGMGRLDLGRWEVGNGEVRFGEVGSGGMGRLDLGNGEVGFGVGSSLLNTAPTFVVCNSFQLK